MLLSTALFCPAWLSALFKSMLRRLTLLAMASSPFWACCACVRTICFALRIIQPSLICLVYHSPSARRCYHDPAQTDPSRAYLTFVCWRPDFLPSLFCPALFLRCGQPAPCKYCPHTHTSLDLDPPYCSSVSLQNQPQVSQATSLGQL